MLHEISQIQKEKSCMILLWKVKKPLADFEVINIIKLD